jgi:hypothetical protein
MAAISPCESELKESAWQNGASMYVAGHLGRWEDFAADDLDHFD